MSESTYKTVKVTLIVQIKAINKQREHSLYSLVLDYKIENANRVSAAPHWNICDCFREMLLLENNCKN